MADPGFEPWVSVRKTKRNPEVQKLNLLFSCSNRLNEIDIPDRPVGRESFSNSGLITSIEAPLFLWDEGMLRFVYMAVAVYMLAHHGGGGGSPSPCLLSQH